MIVGKRMAVLTNIWIRYFLWACIILLGSWSDSNAGWNSIILMSCILIFFARHRKEFDGLSWCLSGLIQAQQHQSVSWSDAHSRDIITGRTVGWRKETEWCIMRCSERWVLRHMAFECTEVRKTLKAKCSMHSSVHTFLPSYIAGRQPSGSCRVVKLSN